MCFDDLPESNEDDSPLRTALAVVSSVTGYCALLSKLKCTTALADGRRKRRDYLRKYAASEQGKETIRRYTERNRAKRSAYNRMRHGLEMGYIVRAKQCEECGATKRIEGHHDDYAKPLVVRWLCRACHKTWHRKNGKALNG